MHKARVAEGAFSLFTTEDIASSMVGDLLEDGTLWFWPAMLGTVLSLLWRDFARRPLFFAGLALGTVLTNLTLTVILLFSSIVAGLGAVVVFRCPQTPVVYVATFLLGAFLLSLFAAGRQTGIWLARFSNDHTAASYIAFLPLAWITGTVTLRACYYCFGFTQGNIHMSGSSWLPGFTIEARVVSAIAFLVTCLALVAGARHERRRKKRA